MRPEGSPEGGCHRPSPVLCAGTRGSALAQVNMSRVQSGSLATGLGESSAEGWRALRGVLCPESLPGLGLPWYMAPHLQLKMLLCVSLLGTSPAVVPWQLASGKLIL